MSTTPTATRGEVAALRARVPEAALVRAILEYLRGLGWLAWRQNSGQAMLLGRGGKPQPVRFGAPGMPDVGAVLPDGRYLAVEAKRPGRHLTREQAAVIAQLHRAGAVALLVYAVDDLARELRARGYVR